MDEHKHLNSNWEEYDHDFINFLKLDKSQAAYICEQTKKQSNCDDWFKYTQGRITASTFHEAILKVSETYEIKNPGKVKTILSKICGQKNNFKSKATEWGKTNEPVACQEYIKLNGKGHKKFSVVETGIFVSCENPIFGASPDGSVSCECHESGLLEIKCQWTHRDKSVIYYAKLEESCLEVIDNVIALKNHTVITIRCKCSWRLLGIPGVIVFYVRQKTPVSRKFILIKHFG